MRAAAINATAMHRVPVDRSSPRFDRSLLADSYREIGETVYGRPTPYYVDDKSGLWICEALTGGSIAEHFLQDPARYLAVFEQCTAEFAGLRNKLGEANAMAAAGSASDMARALRLCAEAYITALKYSHLALPVAACWCSELRAFLLRHLPRRDANIYLTSMLDSPAAAEAIERGVTEEIGHAGPIAAVESPPVLVFAETRFPRALVMDANVSDQLLRSGDSLAAFWSLRTLAPVAAQLAEACRYAEYSARTHLKHVLANARRCSEALNDPYGLGWRDVLALLDAASTASNLEDHRRDAPRRTGELQ